MRIVALCSGEVRQEPKKPVESAFFVAEKGIEGDGHFGLGERQVSLLRLEDVQKAEEEAGFPFPPGSLAENLVIEGLPEELTPGMLLRFGEGVVLEVVEKGKRPDEPHSYSYRGWCLLPKVGYFLRIAQGGKAKSGDAVTLG